MVVSMSEIPPTALKNWERVPGHSEYKADADDKADACSDADAGIDADAEADADADADTDADTYQGLQCSMKSQSRSQFQAMLEEDKICFNYIPSSECIIKYFSVVSKLDWVTLLVASLAWYLNRCNIVYFMTFLLPFGLCGTV